MVDSKDSSKGTMREFFRAAGKLFSAAGLISLAAALGLSAFVGWQVLKTGQGVGDVVNDNYEWTQRVVFGRHKHQPSPQKVDNEKWTEADEKDAVALAKDTEGEFENKDPKQPTQENRRDEAMRKAANIILRAREQGVTDEVHFEKAFMWLPFTWEHQKHASWKAKLVGGWKDRDLDTTKKGITTNVLDRARKIWKEVRNNKSDPGECAIILIRAIDHPFTDDSGERSARKYIPEHYKLDPAVDLKRYRTKFYCTPEEAERVRVLLEEKKK